MVSQPSTLHSQLSRGGSRHRGLVLRGSQSEGGFALLITITMLAFVVVLLIGLAAYTRVETAVAGNTQRQAQARENALLALDVALGQLQEYAGSDKRVSATAAAFGGTGPTARFTGVWPTDSVDDPDADPLTPLTWLVSGNELRTDDGTYVNPLAVKPDATLGALNSTELLGAKTSGAASDVRALLMPIQTAGVPGVSTTGPAATIGRYAWWIGDQGVKAPVAVADTSSAINYAPFGDGTSQNDLGGRIRQQIALGASAADASGAAVFDPRDSDNTSLVAGQKIAAANQFAFLWTTRNGGRVRLGLAPVQQNYHAWSPNNYAVLANTKLGGLRQDLSLFTSTNPSPLGAAYDAWADYTTYMEPPDANAILPPGTLAISPNYAADPLRRRYFMQSGPPMISPVLSFFLLSFNVRTLPTPGGNPSASPQPVQVRMRGAFTLWNPYSSALVPENLRLEVSNLPATLLLDDQTNPISSGPIPFASLFGSPVVKFSLPWSASSATPPTDDRHSWLPGRTHSWTIAEDISGNPPPPDGYLCKLNSQMDPAVFGDGVHRLVPGLIVDGSDQCHIETRASTQFVVTVIAERASGDVILGSFTSPRFDPFSTTSRDLGSFTFTPTFVFRLAENDNGPGLWLATAGLDPRESTVPGDAYTVGTTGYVNGPAPEQYENVRTVSAPDRLLDRDVVSFSYNEDTPIFELPRAPLLSLGQLQHFPLTSQRPFAIGNSWAGATQLNGISTSELFDRYFFSGLVGSIAPATVNGSPPLPNPLLRMLRDSATGVATSPADLQGAPNAQSSKFLLQGGAFNLNSTNPTAWAAILRSVRFVSSSAADQFKFLDATFDTGTNDDAIPDAVPGGVARNGLRVLTTDPVLGEAVFFRFSQSAQETYLAFPGYAASTVDPLSGQPAGPPSAARTELFRKGMRKLNAGQVAELSRRIADAIAARIGAIGPFRSLEEFLAPAVAGTPSLLEQAIIDADSVNAQINIDPNGIPLEFSSQFLTQADIMTALAPVLFPRSDTFVIRAYGEAVNPATSATEGRAWCEAIVQRVPEYVDPTDAADVTPTTDLNTKLGRRFKVVSFRWLTRADI